VESLEVFSETQPDRYIAEGLVSRPCLAMARWVPEDVGLAPEVEFCSAHDGMFTLYLKVNVSLFLSDIEKR
jgi:uncharacterized protein (DUF2237 family)